MWHVFVYQVTQWYSNVMKRVHCDTGTGFSMPCATTFSSTVVFCCLPLSLSLHCLFPISPYYHPSHGVLSYTHFFLHNGYFLSAIYFNILTFYRVLLIRSYFWRTQCRLHRSCNWLSILNFSVGDPLLLVSCSLFSLPFFRSLCLPFSLFLPVFGHNLCY